MKYRTELQERVTSNTFAVHSKKKVSPKSTNREKKVETLILI